MPHEPTVFVVDDDRGVRDSLAWLVKSVDLKVETFASAKDFLTHYRPERPGCLVVDVRMPEMSGLELQDALNKRNTPMAVVVMTGFGDVPTAVRAMKQGAVDFIEKPFSDQTMIELIQSAIEKDAAQRRGSAMRAEAATNFQELTEREQEVLELVVDGKSNKEVARQLGIAPKTVEAHRAKVMEKMKAASFAELVQIAGLCLPPPHETERTS